MAKINDKTDKIRIRVISSFRHEVAENCTLLGYYAASNGNFYCLLHNNMEEWSSQNKNKLHSIETRTYSHP